MTLDIALTLTTTAFAAIIMPISSVLDWFLAFPAQTTAVGLGISALTTYCDSKVRKKRAR